MKLAAKDVKKEMWMSSKQRYLVPVVALASLSIAGSARAQIDTNPPLQNVMLLVDTSGSMGYGREGQKTKLEYGQVLCAALSYLLLRQKDPAGLLCFGSAPATYMPPRGQAAHLSDLCGALCQLTADGGSDLPRALTYLSELARRRSGRARS